jgi:stage II sporulation protein D
MKILVGLKGPGLTELPQSAIKVVAATLKVEDNSGKEMPFSGLLSAKASGANILISGNAPDISKTFAGPVRITVSNNRFKLQLLSGSGAVRHAADYLGELVIRARNGKLIVLLESDLEKYVQGVLRSEIPAAYHIEAMKAQAVLARSYALHPRINHSSEGFNVCDSFLCCQAFNGIDPSLTESQKQAIMATRGQVITYNQKPALALFSASAGGHTEDYSNCFSNLETNQFPDNPIPYLKGIPEGKLPTGFPEESAMRRLWNDPSPDTVDAWSPSFRWKVTFSADTLDAHMHHTIEKMLKETQFAPFIKAPASGKFGHIEGFEVARRGVSGVAMELLARTSTGTWSISKELAIRSVFANPELKIKRLRSGRIFFDQQTGKSGLTSITVYGLGSGHGVGLQQNGAQGLALKGMRYEDMLRRYYPGTEIAKVD